jgi:hypothetical protein
MPQELAVEVSSPPGKATTTTCSLEMLPFEQNLPTSRVAITGHARRQDTSLHKILHQAKDETIAASRRHDIDRHWQDFLVKCNVAEVARGTDYSHVCQLYLYDVNQEETYWELQSPDLPKTDSPG